VVSASDAVGTHFFLKRKEKREEKEIGGAASAPVRCSYLLLLRLLFIVLRRVRHAVLLARVSLGTDKRVLFQAKMTLTPCTNPEKFAR